MKIPILFLFSLALCISCQDKKAHKSQNPSEEIAEKQLTTAETIAHKNGLENWKDVSEIHFTFNVDRGDAHSERSWIWKPKTNDITMKTAKDTISFNRSNLDSISRPYDAAFINDKYWLLAPYNLVWDEGTTLSEATKQVAPISGDTINKITTTYGKEGGYTPGDAYDFFYDDDFIVKEWIFRKSNSKKPSMTTTWEDYENFNGLNIAKMHQDSTGGFKLYFTNISVKK
ncbi:MAG: hypothetical protein CMC70_11295 [Flavobacteriaceae bacterium]|nr:hypothetical protein [Flavobacteriaceae bacterium]|tara:strand:- start:292 stop:978 length:687 start_codon:yes stop_codon:yes gene_type:complete